MQVQLIKEFCGFEIVLQARKTKISPASFIKPQPQLTLVCDYYGERHDTFISRIACGGRSVSVDADICGCLSCHFLHRCSEVSD